MNKNLLFQLPYFVFIDLAGWTHLILEGDFGATMVSRKENAAEGNNERR